MGPSRLFRGLLPLVGVCALSIGALVGCHSGGNAETPAKKVEWHPCPLSELECGELTAPLDYSEPTGATLRLALIRHTASDPTHRIGSLVVNPGGPGASGVDFLPRYLDAVPPAVAERFDIVSYDPRGVSQDHHISCIDFVTPTAPTPRASLGYPAADETRIAQAASYADACLRNSGDDLAHVDTVSGANDLERIRIALGEEKLNYLGYSYGTLLGLEYAAHYPAGLRASVLDGAVDPALGYEQFEEQSARGLERAFDRFLADCAQRVECSYHSNGDPSAAFDQLLTRITAAPLPDSLVSQILTHWGRREVLTAVARGLYSHDRWTELSDALAAAERGNSDGLAHLLEPRDRDPISIVNQSGAHTAITCLDTPVPTDIAAQEAFIERVREEAPRFGDVAASAGLPCAFWHFPPVGHPGAIAAPGAPPILVVGTVGDPATPYEWAQAVTSELDSARLLTWNGDGHTAFGGLSECIDHGVVDYLVDLKLPAIGASCD